jgi:hypothetical protein
MQKELPSILKELHRIPFEYAGGNGFDFEPFQEFLSESEMIDWLKAWTGNEEITSSDFLVFGMDGSGGYVAFWKITPDMDILNQPIVFLGSEGEKGVVAESFHDYLWLLAQGFGPCEVIESGVPAQKEYCLNFLHFAEKKSKVERRPAKEIIQTAQERFSDFTKFIDDMIR